VIVHKIFELEKDCFYGSRHIPCAVRNEEISRFWGYGTRSVPATLLRHSECACYFAAILHFATALGACLLLCSDSRGVTEFRRLRVQTP